MSGGRTNEPTAAPRPHDLDVPCLSPAAEYLGGCALKHPDTKVYVCPRCRTDIAYVYVSKPTAKWQKPVRWLYHPSGVQVHFSDQGVRVLKCSRCRKMIQFNWPFPNDDYDLAGNLIESA